MPRILIIAAGAAGYLCIAGPVAAYLAGALYFVVNKSMPHDVGFDTWFRYWQAYADNPVQHHRLVMAGVGAALTVLAAPLIILMALASGDRSLHGDARWATTSEIRKAGLL